MGLTDDNQFVTIIFPDRTVLKCKKIIYSAGDIASKEGEWEHGTYGEFDISEVVHALQHQNQMMVESSTELLRQQGMTVEDLIEMVAKEQQS